MMSVQTMLELAEEYLASRRNLGYALMIEGAELVRFARYADRIGHRGPISTQLAVQWSKLPVGADPIYWARRLDIVRRFARYRALFDPATEIPQPGLLGRAYRRPTPYIYSDDEVAALLKAARSLGPAGGLRPHTYETLFGLLACTGLRISEALGLTDQDVNLERGILMVRASKFKKSRLVPLHPSATSALHRYAEHRRRYHPAVKSDAFFLTERATSLKYHKTLMTFLALSTKLGWRSSKCRIHDLRHRFAVRCLLEWYKQGVDVDRRIAILATYMGHVKISDTYWYLTAAPELLAIAGGCFERFAECLPGVRP